MSEPLFESFDTIPGDTIPGRRIRLPHQASTGPASLMFIDPDGNPILIDQHVPKQ